MSKIDAATSEDSASRSATDERLVVPAVLRALLRAGETAIAWLDIDLDDRLFYAQGLVGVTTERVVFVPNAAFDKSYGKKTAPDDPPQEWLIPRIQGAVCYEAAGLGSLELLGNEQLLARWNYTAKEFAAASRVAREINHLVRAGTIATREATATATASRSASPV